MSFRPGSCIVKNVVQHQSNTGNQYDRTEHRIHSLPWDLPNQFLLRHKQLAVQQAAAASFALPWARRSAILRQHNRGGLRIALKNANLMPMPNSATVLACHRVGDALNSPPTGESLGIAFPAGRVRCTANVGQSICDAKVRRAACSNYRRCFDFTGLRQFEGVCAGCSVVRLLLHREA